MNNTQNIPPTASSEHADYGFDAPKVPLFLGLGGIAGLIAAVVSWILGWGVLTAVWFGVVGVVNLASAGLYVYATRRGKHQAWAKILDSIPWRGDETVLDLGCGRGAILIAAAHRLPQGRAVGVDIWDTGDQSGNSIEVTRRNAELEGVANRVQLETADIRDLPFHEGSFDAVFSSLVLHNIHSHDGRSGALAAAMHVLRPGGRLLVADILHLNEYRLELQRLGLEEVRVHELGLGTWFGNPFMRTRLVSGTKATRA
jgi:arsenite methyltransferase